VGAFGDAFGDLMGSVGGLISEAGSAAISVIKKPAEEVAKAAGDEIRRALPVWTAETFDLQRTSSVANPLGTARNGATQTEGTATIGKLPFGMALAELSTVETLLLGALAIGGGILALRMARIL
jgi:hypothetical protein